MKYVALLRGVNVGGKSLVKMADLKTAVEAAGFVEVSTYINSGNVFFSSDETDKIKLANIITEVIDETFGLDVKTVVLSADDIQTIIENMPKGWGENPDWKYNTLFLLPPCDANKVIEEVGELKPEIEILQKGEGVLYQAVEFKSFGRSRTGKLASLPCYKHMTIRNHNTIMKLHVLLTGV
jgi:uncharacterized protein (DUF1697 family)